MYYIEPRHEKTCLCHTRTTKYADQPAHSAQSDQRLCSSLPTWYCIISVFAIIDISSLLLISVAEQTGLSLTWSENRKTGFLMTRLINTEQVLTKCVEQQVKSELKR